MEWKPKKANAKRLHEGMVKLNQSIANEAKKSRISRMPENWRGRIIK